MMYIYYNQSSLLNLISEAANAFIFFLFFILSQNVEQEVSGLDVRTVAAQAVPGQIMPATMLPGLAKAAVIQATEGQNVNRVSCVLILTGILNL